MATKKINWILILQGWAILWVVIGHAPLLPINEMPQPAYVSLLYDTAYSFHMPLFVFVSGYLFRMTRIERPMPYVKMISEKLQRLGIPFIVFTIIAMVFKSIFSADMARPATFSAGEFVNAVLYPGDGPLGELWFIATLMWYFALRPLWSIDGVCRYILIIVATLLFFLPDVPTKDFMCYKQVLHYAIFFSLGIIAEAENIFSVSFLRYILAMATAALAYAVLFGGGISALIEIIIPMLGITVSILIAMTADRYIPRMLSSFRDYSYQIYLMGIFVQIAIKILYRHGLLPHYGTGYVLCIAGGLYLPVLASIAIKKLNNKYLKLCIGLK